MQEEYVQYLKDQQPLDELIIDLLYFGVSITEVAKRCGVSRQHVYTVIDRSKKLLLKYKVLDISE